MLGSWWFIGRRMLQRGAGANQQVRHLRSFFLYMGIFCLLIFLPHTLLGFAPNGFPQAMAWGYIIGHVSLYIGLIYILRLTFSMVPRLADKEKYVIAAAALVGTAITIANIKTMAFGTLPQHDSIRNITLLNTAPPVGAAIGAFALVSTVPAIVLILVNGVRNPDARLRSFLLGGGLLVLMTGGPIHDIARTWQLYMVADVVSIVGLVIVTTGVLYRLEERIDGRQVRPSDLQRPSVTPSRL
jgi:hypothetical protein